MFKLDLLDALSDDELQSAINHAEGLIKQRYDDRKEKAKRDAAAILAAVGLSLKDLNGKAKAKPKARAYHTGHQYQHPTNKVLNWNGKGKKPAWLTALEADGKTAVEVS